MTDQHLIKTVANIITNQLIAHSDKIGKPIDQLMSKQNIIDLATFFNDGKLNNQSLAKAIDVLVDFSDDDFENVLKKHNLIQTNDTDALQKIVDSVLNTNPTQVEQYKAGKVNVVGYLVGQCMKQAGGSGNPKIFNQLLKVKLS